VLRGLSLPVSLLIVMTVPVSLNFFSSPLMLLFVHHLFGNSFINSIAVYLQRIQIFDQNLIFVAKNHVYKHCGEVCNDIILMPRILEVWQHILGVVGNVCLLFCSKFNTDFPAVREF